MQQRESGRDKGDAKKSPASFSSNKARSYLNDSTKGSLSKELEFLELIEVTRKLPLHPGDEWSIEDVALWDD